MKIGCGSVVFRKLSLKEALQRIKDAKYEYIEIQATGPFCPHVDVDNDDPKKISEMIRNFGFREITALWASHGAIIPDDLSMEYIKKSILWAKEAGIPIVHLSDGFKPEEINEDEAWDIFESRLSKLLETAEDTAEDNNVCLAIEPHGTFSLTPEGLERIMNISDSKCLGINYDTANVHRAAYIETVNGKYELKQTGNVHDEVETLKRIVKRVVHVHVKDISSGAADAECVTLGTGVVNVKGCLKVLKENGYDGVISLETEGSYKELNVAQKMIEDSRKYLITVFKELNWS